MKLGILKEKYDKRVAIVPSSIVKLSKFGIELFVESNAGANSFISDDEYKKAGAVISSSNEILSNSDIIVSVEALESSELNKIKNGASYISMLKPYEDEQVKKNIENLKINVFSLDMLPRTSLAQSMDILSSMASIAGYKAVLMAANLLPSYFPMLITSAGTIKPSKVFVLGAGVAGLQAIATAKRLGAIVEAMDTRAASEEEVKSLGGKFIKVEGAKDATSGGYGAVQSEEFIQKQRELTYTTAIGADVIICTAQVRGRKAPVIITKKAVENMKKGSVIIDLAASTGGNCEVTENNKTINYNGITIVGNSNLASEIPKDASTLFSNNIINFLSILINKEGKINIDMNNQIIKETLISKQP